MNGRHDYARHRLFVDAPLGSGQDVVLDKAAAHHLFTVLRRSEGDALLLFNGRDGEWAARITSVGKREGVVRVEMQTRAQKAEPDLWLLFAPLKKNRTDFVVEKAVELGVSKLVPVFTEYTNATRLNDARLRAQVIDAASQCERISVPDVAKAQKLDTVLRVWPKDRPLIFANEHIAGEGSALERLRSVGGPAAVLVGPEGGFSSGEVTKLRQMRGCVEISLGPRILRADTACVAALSLWQAISGDWT
jgi:16S rRNA (uracil1498-N3)-methyltransferase